MKEEKRRLLQEFVQCDMARIAPCLGPTTFQTTAVPLSVSEARALRQNYRSCVYGEPLPEECAAALSALTVRLQETMSRVSGGGGFFVRLFSRSPKDALLYDMPKWPQRRAEVFRALVSGLEEVYRSDSSAGRLFNEEYRTLARVGLAGMRVENAEEALLLLSHSERIFSDINVALEFSAGGEGWSASVVVRPWVELRPEYEFRAFSSRGVLTAIAQYDPYVFVPELQRPEEKRRVCETLVRFFDEEVKPRLPQDLAQGQFVIDFGFVRATDQPIVIELNGWGEHTGCACFSWRNDRDVLDHGPLEFRVVEEHDPTRQLSLFLDPVWVSLIEDARSVALAHIQQQEKSWKCSVC